jgi:hypothetical protein
LIVGLGRPREGEAGHKKQGRRRNIPSTTLPAPDIEIGSRHPVSRSMPRIVKGKCEPDHILPRKLTEVFSLARNVSFRWETAGSGAGRPGEGRDGFERAGSTRRLTAIAHRKAGPSP